MDVANALLGTSVVATGLVSGLLYGWTVSVIPGLRRIPDPSYVATMQSINKAIINPAFIVPFMGIPLVLGGAAIVQYRAGDQRRGALLAAATATYLVGVLGVTRGRNIPLNDALEAFDLPDAGGAALNERRKSYEDPWNKWHYLRTVASVGSFALTAAAAIVASTSE